MPLIPSVLAVLTMATTDPHGAQTERAPNELLNETSPYLLQHAYNPVQWYPWGQEAIEKARLEDKPIFLSVGYSTCYWCHVMERESFESEDIAAMLNEHFVPVKVDREERPDVDDIYMTAVQVMTGSGGWPMSVFIEPGSLKPFFGGTYFPPSDMGGRPGFGTLLEAIHEAWIDPAKRVELEGQADRLAAAVEARLAAMPEPALPTRSVVDAAVAQLMSTYDEQDGGFGGAPKFPTPPNLQLLMATAWDRPDVQQALMHTLDRMVMGGIYDQVGGGFHRYSTDARWLVPHFEKMLYDNGQLASVYAEAAMRTDEGLYRAVASEIADYVLRDMIDASGAFWSAQDAESNAREGESYIWTPVEVDAALTAGGLDADDIAFAHRVYGLSEGANFRDPHHASDPRWVLHLVDHPSKLAAAEGVTGPAFHQWLVRVNEALKVVRDAREQPITDDKVLAGWNGLMIAGLADTARATGEQRYIDAAIAAADAIRLHMWNEETGLKRSMRGGEARIDAFLEDYALLGGGAMALHRATGDPQWLNWAQQLADQAKERFFVTESGWFDMPAGDALLFVRGRSLYDGAMPAGTSAMLALLVALAEATEDERWLDLAAQTGASIGPVLERSPRSMPVAVRAIDGLLRHKPLEQGAVEASAKHSEGAVTAHVIGLPSSLAGGASATARLVLTMDKGWHVTLPGTNDEFAMPLQVDPGDPTLEVQIDWPKGHALQTLAGEVQVLEGTVEIPLRIQRAQGGADAPVSIVVTWQACDDQMCKAPVTHRFGEAP
ncbi:MAG: DUF255 domain-containing protein [Phycisphaerales bacterium]|nr:DUF255 domain-containing protein [Phycisphaerales bacterium]